MQRKLSLPKRFWTIAVLVAGCLALFSSCSYLKKVVASYSGMVSVGQTPSTTPAAGSGQEERLIKLDLSRLDEIFIYPNSVIVDAGVLDSDPAFSYFAVMETNDAFDEVRRFYEEKKQQHNWRLFPVIALAESNIPVLSGREPASEKKAGLEKTEVKGSRTQKIAIYKYLEVDGERVTLVRLVQKGDDVVKIEVITW